MSRQMTVTCDRCGKKFDKAKAWSNIGEAKPGPHTLAALVVSVLGEQVLKFEDVCEKCSERLKNLVLDMGPSKRAKSNGGDSDE